MISSTARVPSTNPPLGGIGLPREFQHLDRQKATSYSRISESVDPSKNTVYVWPTLATFGQHAYFVAFESLFVFGHVWPTLANIGQLVSIALIRSGFFISRERGA